MFDEVNPKQAVLVTTRADVEILGKEVHKDNIFALTWHTPLSFAPKLFGIIVGRERFSHEMIKKSKSFCVNFISIDNEEDLLFCGRNSGRTVDKFEKTALERDECEAIDCPRIKNSLGYLECELIDEKKIGDHTLFIGKVLKNDFHPGKRIFYKGLDKFTTTM